MGWIELEPYDPTWRTAYESEAGRIRELAGEGLRGVFHVGSTAVPGLAAKPIVDVLAVYASTDAVNDAKAILLDEYRVHRNEPDRVVLLKETGGPGFTLHLRPVDARDWPDQIVFRELLRADDAARQRYEEAKRTAASEHPDDGQRYTAAKQPTIEALTDRAYEEGYDERLPAFAPDR